MTNSWRGRLLSAVLASVVMISSTHADPLCDTEVSPPPAPIISGGSKYFLDGDTFSINCTVNYNSTTLVNLVWEYPENIVPSLDKSNVDSEDLSVTHVLYRNITIINATRQHRGTYVCISKNNCGKNNVSFTKEYLAQPILEMTAMKRESIRLYATKKPYRENIRIKEYPAATFYFLRDDKNLSMDGVKYQYSRGDRTGDVIFSVNNTEVTDTANYTLVGSNGHLTKSVTIDLRIYTPPIVQLGLDADPNTPLKYTKNVKPTLVCLITAYPLPDDHDIYWTFTDEEGNKSKSNSIRVNRDSIYHATAYLEPVITMSGNITCSASNKWGSDTMNRELLGYEIDHGFGITDGEDKWFTENDDVTIRCVASKYDYSNVTWTTADNKTLTGTTEVQYLENSYSHVAKLKISNITREQSGKYVCRAKLIRGAERLVPYDLRVEAVRNPVILEPWDTTEELYPFQPIQLNCQVYAVPLATLVWYKDSVELTNNTDMNIITRMINHTEVNSTINITKMHDEYYGTYECVAHSRGKEVRRTFTLKLKEASYTKYWSAILVIILILIVIVVYLTWKIKKEKQFRKELAAAGLLYFKEGVTKSLNPDLGVDEQAELLPYDDKFEFPPDKLILGKQLGAGAFGVVYKADARGIINAEETTVVAVKMVKKTADNMYIKALASELKIMVHLGKHVNIVNLLGACTKDVGKRELIVIVEYCKFGNIHNYMQKHREVFIDQLTDNNEKNFGRVNRGFSTSSGSTGTHYGYFGSTNTQDTDHTFVNTANTSRSARKVSEGYVQPEWRSNYESDYSDGRNPRPLTSRDLLVWAFQIASGMEYLVSRKVLHGDLAARNILLAEDNIVKICDFGLARSIYKNDEYQKKEGSLLPVKWLAIECMTDRIFSTQSDVWSFGIVLWELFSLAKTPYPNISPAYLLDWLNKGHRLDKPTYADDRLYDVMLKCWAQKPTTRPTFTQLQQTLGGFLEDNVRNHYVDLNSENVCMNLKEGQEDYLAMMCAPDYNNIVTPHYENNSSFFPTTPTQLDEDGYLQMTSNTKQNIFNPQFQKDAKFDFDCRKLNPKMSEASSCGSELTPMLTLTNLPARSGSESDYEGNASPYSQMCPRIDEEADDVFEVKQNNAKNVQNTAVTNPTYISLDVDIEKKPNDINNAYMNVPNGLVK